MNLVDIIDNSKSDKNTTHSYLSLYQNLLESKRFSAKNVLEVGIGGNDCGEFGGGSIKLWSDFFTNATIHAVDIRAINAGWERLKNSSKNILLYTSTDAYNKESFVENFLSKNIKFDFMLDDGPHSMESMKQFIILYSQIMTDDGILIIENVQELEWLEDLESVVPEHLKKYVKSYDLRQNKNRYDDIVFTIDKLNI